MVQPGGRKPRDRACVPGQGPCTPTAWVLGTQKGHTAKPEPGPAPAVPKFRHRGEEGRREEVIWRCSSCLVWPCVLTGCRLQQDKQGTGRDSPLPRWLHHLSRAGSLHRCVTQPPARDRPGSAKSDPPPRLGRERPGGKAPVSAGTHKSRGVVVLDGLGVPEGLQDGVGLQQLSLQLALERNAEGQ